MHSLRHSFRLFSSFYFPTCPTKQQLLQLTTKRIPRSPPLPHPAQRRMLSAGSTIRGESGVTYHLLNPLGSRTRESPSPNIWKVIQESDRPADLQPEFIAKAPSPGDSEAQGWPGFHHEAKMQRLFAEDPMLRRMADFVPVSEETLRPVMVLEPFQKTLWDARTTRALSTREIKWIMKGVLLGIMTVHRKGLVYTDLKMENIGISGFDNEESNDDVHEIVVRLADPGAISKPGTCEISALSYRSPEVLFGKPWDYSTDVWSWGIILAQLLLAQVDFKSPGMYDNMAVGSLEEKTKAVRDGIAVDFDLYSHPLYAEDPKGRAILPPPQPEMAYKWAEAMMDKGVDGEAIQFLANTLNPLPGARFTTVEILESGYLDR